MRLQMALNHSVGQVRKWPEVSTKPKVESSKLRRVQMAPQATSRKYLLLFLVTVYVLLQLAVSLRFSSVQIPSLVQRNTNFWLSCQFELEQQHRGTLAVRSDQLYSVKWYKNNEEFYRLMLAEIAAATSSSQLQSQHQQQQQYFAQAGINVMMSASNATHVRLLNASLESEGVYACEISTQNLSTIRYERELRVYVLPHSKLNIIGLRARYSIGDQVDLICSSDFSRPEPALAWFINGHRIPTSSDWFELENQAKSKLNEPTLFRLSLSLKFKLTHELLMAVASTSTSLAANSSSPNSELLLAKSGNINKQAAAALVSAGEQDTNQRNQSHGRRHQSATRSSTTSQRKPQTLPSADLLATVARQLKLRLQCKYRLTEVSDVTFNELVVRQARTAITTASMLKEDGAAAGDDDNDDDNESDNDNSGDGQHTVGDEFADNRKWPVVAASGGRSQGASISGMGSGRPEVVWVSKTSGGNQVAQGKCPAERAELLRWALAPTERAGGRGAPAARPERCELGSLALQPDDPLILESTRADNRRRSSRGKGRRRRQLETTSGDQLIEANSPGELISVNCSTMSALLGDAALAAAGGGDNSSSNNNNNHENDDDSDTNLMGADTTGDRVGERRQWPAVVAKPHTKGPANYCADAGARKRLVISGKYRATTTAAANEEAPSLGASNQRSTTQSVGTGARPSTLGRLNNRQVAYLSLSSVATGIASDNNNNNWLTADSADSARQQQQLRAQAQQDYKQLLAPPLLEWFINNQEAPTSSASYVPPLPLVTLETARRRSGVTQATVTSADISKGGLPSHAVADPMDSNGPTRAHKVSENKNAQVDEDSFLLAQVPSVDYKEYFANFDSRSIQQHLALSLTLAKKHFMTPDSKLRLRCSSTQAQVLMADSASVFVVAIADSGAVQSHHQSSSSTTGHSGWQLRPANLYKPWHPNSPAGQQIIGRHQLVRPGSQASSRTPSNSASSLFRYSNNNNPSRYCLFECKPSDMMMIICMLVALLPSMAFPQQPVHHVY